MLKPVGVSKYRQKPTAAHSDATTAGPVPKNHPSMISTSRSTWAAVGPFTGGPSNSSVATAIATNPTARPYRRSGGPVRWYDPTDGTRSEERRGGQGGRTQ